GFSPVLDCRTSRRKSPCSCRFWRVVTKATAVLQGEGSGLWNSRLRAGLPECTCTGYRKAEGPRTQTALRGFHIHQSGDLTNGCASTGGHYNPYSVNHGAPEDRERHVGDLGNIKTDEKGEANFSFEDRLLSLNGPLSILGRGVVLHTGNDDLGRGGNEDSLKTGNAGGRAACGVIGLA
ncbi:superoxide dismutase, partial [Ephemerocybe angulata]